MPDPADTDPPPDGQTYTTGSGDELMLPPPLGVACAAGAGDAFFSLDLTGPATGDTTDVTITRPGSQPAGMHWRYPSGGSWTGMDIGGTDGTGQIVGGLSPGTPQAI